MKTIRTLILSGGGGRGAFHAGVYKYLDLDKKTGLDSAHNGKWSPDIVVGTSIGAVNGAAIVQDISADKLIEFWQSLREHDIQGLPPQMTPLMRWLANRLIKKIIGVPLPKVPMPITTAHKPSSEWSLLPGFGKLSDMILGKWNSLFDTGPLKQTMIDKLGLKEELINHSPKTLMINATNVRTGKRTVFSNKPIYQKSPHQPHPDVITGITISRILASCSIPLVYPWTYDEQTNGIYWDGAIVSNTPLGIAIDAANNRPSDETMEIVVVMMTPWYEENANGAQPMDPYHSIPKDFNEAITWTLDWALLASFREQLKLIKAHNQFKKIGLETGNQILSEFRQVKVIIIAPENFFPAARILDYDEYNQNLINLGFQAAQKAFHHSFQRKAGR